MPLLGGRSLMLGEYAIPVPRLPGVPAVKPFGKLRRAIAKP